MRFIPLLLLSACAKNAPIVDVDGTVESEGSSSSSPRELEDNTDNDDENNDANNAGDNQQNE